MRYVRTNLIMKRLRQIAVDERNYEELKEMGKAGDSFNDVITLLLGRRKGGMNDSAKSQYRQSSR